MKTMILMLTLSINAQAMDDKAFNKAFIRLRSAQKLNACLDEAKAYAEQLRLKNDDHGRLDECLKDARRLERLKKLGF